MQQSLKTIKILSLRQASYQATIKPSSPNKSFLKTLLEPLLSDFQIILERDTVARNWLEVIFCYPGLHAISLHHLTCPKHQTNLHPAGKLPDEQGNLISSLLSPIQKLEELQTLKTQTQNQELLGKNH
jgi:hypothetical protein